MKRKTKYNYGGWIEDFFNSSMNHDPMLDYTAQKFRGMKESPSYIEDPNTSLALNNMNRTKAMKTANNNPWTKGMDLLGSAAVMYGTNMMGKGSNTLTPKGEMGATDGFGGWINQFMGMKKPTAAYGGTVPVEVEGDEVGQLPGGQLLDFDGPSHEAGGIDALLPGGTTMFSKRIKIDGKTMAERKKLREKKASKFEKLSKNNPTDVLVKNSFKRNKEVNDAENNFDLSLQETVAKMFENEGKEKLQYGTPLEGIKPNPLWEGQYSYPDVLPEGYSIYGTKITEPPFEFNPYPNIDNTETGSDPGYPNPITEPIIHNKKPLTKSESAPDTGEKWNWKPNPAAIPTFGDALGMFGNMKQAYDPYKLTLENRASGTPNINFAKEYGKEGLRTLQDAKGYIAEIRDKNLQDLNVARASSTKRNRNSARGINTQRALDLATDSQVNKSMSDIYSNFANQMMGVMSNEAGMKNMRDSMIIQGEQQKDTADRMDRDIFYSNLAKDKAAIGEALTRTGKSINAIKGRGVNQNFLNQLSDYVQTNIMNGTITAKEGINLISDNDEKIKVFKETQSYLKLDPPMTKEEFEALPKRTQIRKIKEIKE